MSHNLRLLDFPLIKGSAPSLLDLGLRSLEMEMTTFWVVLGPEEVGRALNIRGCARSVSWIRCLLEWGKPQALGMECEF